MLNLKIIRNNKPEDVNLILGQSHFIKTVEDLYETLVGNVPDIKFGLAFVESSGACKVRSEGNEPSLKRMAEDELGLSLRAAAYENDFVVLSFFPAEEKPEPELPPLEPPPEAPIEEPAPEGEEGEEGPGLEDLPVEEVDWEAMGI